MLKVAFHVPVLNAGAGVCLQPSGSARGLLLRFDKLKISEASRDLFERPLPSESDCVSHTFGFETWELQEMPIPLDSQCTKNLRAAD